jgi:ubiquinone/menaquinone biosynthesis C-methylase UbiE
MRRVDYDVRLYRDYARGRELTEARRHHWAATFSRHLPPHRPLNGMDVGSGTGRFTPLLADTFAGPVIGVEPSRRMLDIAAEVSTHPLVEYRSGSADDLPLPDTSVDYALLFLVWHHVADKSGAARELARVVRPGGILLLRSQFADRMPFLWWLDAFPRGHELDALMFQPVADVQQTFADAGWKVMALDETTELPATATRAEWLQRLRKRSFSLFEHWTEDEIVAGFTELERRIAANPDEPIPPNHADLLVLSRV